MEISDERFEEIWGSIQLAQDMRKARPQDYDRLAIALSVKLSHSDFALDPKDSAEHLLKIVQEKIDEIGRRKEEIVEATEVLLKYEGYIEREKFIAEKLHRLENIRIPEDFDFHSMNSLTIEARQKLTRIRPATIGQASRIPGVSPADVNGLLVKFGR